MKWPIQRDQHWDPTMWRWMYIMEQYIVMSTHMQQRHIWSFFLTISFTLTGLSGALAQIFFVSTSMTRDDVRSSRIERRSLHGTSQVSGCLWLKFCEVRRVWSWTTAMKTPFWLKPKRAVHMDAERQSLEFCRDCQLSIQHGSCKKKAGPVPKATRSMRSFWALIDQGSDQFSSFHSTFAWSSTVQHVQVFIWGKHRSCAISALVQCSRMPRKLGSWKSNWSSPNGVTPGYFRIQALKLAATRWTLHKRGFQVSMLKKLPPCTWDLSQSSFYFLRMFHFEHLGAQTTSDLDFWVKCEAAKSPDPFCTASNVTAAMFVEPMLCVTSCLPKHTKSRNVMNDTFWKNYMIKLSSRYHVWR